MKHAFALIFFLVLSQTGFAAGADTVRAASSGSCWSIYRRLGAGERLSLLDQRYKLPAGTLERAYPALAQVAGNGETIEVPIGGFNRLTGMPWSLDTARPVYYKVQPGERLADISRCSRMSRNDLMLINGLSGEPPAGSYLCVGWVRYDKRLIASSPLPVSRVPATQMPPPPPLPRTYTDPVQVDTIVSMPRPQVQTMGDIWNEQTNNGEYVTNEKGSVAFYTLNSKAPGAAAYAFHNAAPRGGIIRVRNLNNGKSIYVKVLGPLPNTKQYAGAILGLTMTAKRALGVQEERAFCELSYAGY